MNTKSWFINDISFSFVICYSKSTFINNEIMSPSMPNMTQIINSKSIAYFVISNMPRNGPIAVPNTKLKENKLMPSLFLLTG